MTHKDNGRLLTNDQRVLGDGVRTLLRRLGVAYTESLESNSAESWYQFHIETPAQSTLQVNIAVVGDVVVFVANGVELRWDLPAREYSSQWISDSLDGLAVVFENDLRIRLRRTSFGTAGAIWFPLPGGKGTWNGDGAAARGEGREDTFPKPWYRRQ